MTIRSAIVAQFRRPSGVLGAIAGTVMASRPSNRRRNAWTIDVLGIGRGERLLELGCGPGLAIGAALRAGASYVLALDHSPVMIRQAANRHDAATASGRVVLRLGNLEALREGDGPFDAAWMTNVAQFLPDRVAAFDSISGVLREGGRLAITYQPRHRGATACDAGRFAGRVAAELADAGFVGTERYSLPLKPVPAICVVGRVPAARRRCVCVKGSA